MTAFILERDVIEASGPDATSFLQGQLSQDLDALAPNESAWSFLLQPQGKVDALVRATRMDGDRWLLDADGGHGDAVLERLNRFKLRVKCELEVLDWDCVAVRDEADPPTLPDAVITAPAQWRAHHGFDVLGPGVTTADAGSPTDYERLRIEAGWPKMGAELTDKTIPAETGLVDLAVSFTKGCFTGQELVARIDSRGGNVPRHLRGIIGDGLTVGARLERDGKQVGAITSAVGDVGLAYVSRDVDVPSDLTIDGSVVRAVPLPIAT